MIMGKAGMISNKGFGGIQWIPLRLSTSEFSDRTIAEVGLTQ
jgi:hypothetical protein